MDIDHSYGFGSALLDFFLPRRCVVCNAVLAPSETHLCENCWSDLPHTYYWLLRNNPMSDRLNAFIQDWLEAKWNISTGTERYAYAAALFFYRAESDYSKITRCIKYHGRVEVGLHFGMLLGDRLAESHLFSDVDAVVPVPLHWMRRWKRGYNQAEVIASGVARRLGVPMKNNILRRCRRTRTQTKLSIAEKRKNVTGAFDVSDKARSNEELKHLLIVDDVFTTGSTLMACFVALREVFPPSVRISVATLGFVGGT